MVPDAGRYIAEINGVKLGYTLVGRGPPLIVVAPGWGIGSHYLQRGLLPLAVRFTLIFLDPRGSGRSGRPANNAAMSSAAMAEDIYALVQHLELASADLLGHSNGGAIALMFAANHPEACGKIVLVDSQLLGFGASEATGEILARARDDLRYTSAAKKVGLPLPRKDDAFTARLKELLPLYFITRSKCFRASWKRWMDRFQRRRFTRNRPPTGPRPSTRWKCLAASAQALW
jgi:proline iminopeptidase